MAAADINSDDYYKVLGVSKGSADNDIAKAYKRQALKYHPDKNPDNKDVAEEQFKRITEAYEVLHDPDKRKQYDQFGKAGLQGGGGGGGGPGGGMSFHHADDIFKAFFGGNDPFSMFFNGDGMDGGGMFMDQGMGGKGGGQRIVFGMPGMGGKGKGSGRRPSAPPAPPPPPHAMANGTEVVVRDLAKAQEHNGKLGRTAGWNASSSRYEVEIGDSDEKQTISLKPANLTQVCSVEVVGIESTPELNGQNGTILNYIEAQARYMVKLKQRMSNGRDTVGLQPINVVLRTGTRVIVQGLSNEAFNGLMGVIKEIDREAMRYTVETQNGKSIKIKLDNVIC